MALTNDRKSELITKFRTHDGDTGSPERGSASIERLGELDRALLRRFRIAVEADPDGSVRYWINDILVASRHYAPFRLEGKVGLLLRGGRAAFSDIRLLY